MVPSPDSGTEGPFASDPFLAMSDFVYDIRIVPARKYTDEWGEPLEIDNCFLDGKLS